LGGVLALILVLQPLEAQPSAQPNHAGGTNISATTHANASAGVPKNSPEHLDPSTIHEIWFFYLSSLAITITAGATLLVALIILKMQSLSISLTAIERLVAEAFKEIRKLDDYLQRASDHFLNERWTDYFDAVGSLAKEHQKLFSREGRYTETKSFVDTLVAQGRTLEERNRQLHTALKPIFIATAMVAGPAILALPAAQWVSIPIITVTWAVTGVFSFILLVFFLHIISISTAFKSK
jgi:hypothetical protein